MQRGEWSLSRRDALAVLGMTAGTARLAFVEPDPDDTPAPPPFRLWTWNEPSGAARADRRIRPLVRVAVDTLNPEDAAGAVGLRALQLRLVPGDVAVLLQNFGMGGGPSDGPAWKRTASTALFMHPADALPAASCQSPFITPWFSRGIVQSKSWFSRFSERLAKACATMPNLPVPSRFHFDSEDWPQVVADARGGVGAFLAMMKDARWEEEPICGFDRPMARLWDEGGRLLPSDRQTWFHEDNRAWASWFQGILFTASSAAFNQSVGSSLAAHWPSCLWSNYVLSSSFDGLDDRFDVDPRNPWLKTIHRSHSPMQAPNVYPFPPTWTATRGLPPTQAALEHHRIMLDRMCRSFGGTPPTRFSPWIEGIQTRTVGGERITSDREYILGAFHLLATRGIREGLLWSDPGSSTPDSWGMLPGLIDEACRP